MSGMRRSCGHPIDDCAPHCSEPDTPAPPAPVPATDEEIEDTRERAHRVTGIGSTRALKLIARIDHDRRLIAEQTDQGKAKDAEIAKLREIIVRYVRAEDALTHYTDETPEEDLVPGVEADLAEEETEALDAIRTEGRVALAKEK